MLVSALGLAWPAIHVKRYFMLSSFMLMRFDCTYVNFEDIVPIAAARAF